MKKITVLLLALLFCFTACWAFGCTPPEKGKVNVKYYAEASNIPPMILSGRETIGLVPEPAASALQRNAQNKGITLYKMDLQELYDGVSKSYPQAVLMVKKSVINAHSGLVDVLEQKITESVSWAKENAGLAVSAIENHGATTLQAAALTAQAIDGCKIYWQGAEQAKQSVKDYINGIIEIDSAKAVRVEDDFFYSNQTGSNQKQSYSFIMPDGAPALAVSKLMHDSDGLSTDKTISYDVVIAGQIRTDMIEGSADFILAPVNLASQFYKEHDQIDHYVMVAVITHGNFYIMSTEQLTVSDLKDKQVAVPMKGAVPDWTFQMTLKKYNLQCITVE